MFNKITAAACLLFGSAALSSCYEYREPYVHRPAHVYHRPAPVYHRPGHVYPAPLVVNRPVCVHPGAVVLPPPAVVKCKAKGKAKGHYKKGHYHY